MSHDAIPARQNFPDRIFIGGRFGDVPDVVTSGLFLIGIRRPLLSLYAGMSITQVEGQVPGYPDPSNPEHRIIEQVLEKLVLNAQS